MFLGPLIGPTSKEPTMFTPSNIKDMSRPTPKKMKINMKDFVIQEGKVINRNQSVAKRRSDVSDSTDLNDKYQHYQKKYRSKVKKRS